MSIKTASSSLPPLSEISSVNYHTEIVPIPEDNGSSFSEITTQNVDNEITTPNQNVDDENHSTTSAAADSPVLSKPKKDTMWKLVNEVMAKKRFQEKWTSLRSSESKNSEALQNQNQNQNAKGSNAASAVSKALARQISTATKFVSVGGSIILEKLRTPKSKPTDTNTKKWLTEVPLQLYKNPTFQLSSEFRNFQAVYDGLTSNQLRSCLLCFSVFPENATIKRRLMIYWWIGADFLSIPNGTETSSGHGSSKSSEDYANEFFYKLIAKGFIEPIYKKESPVVNSCKMHPFVRTAVITLAERDGFFNFDSKGNATAEISRSGRACLAGEGLTKRHNLEKLRVLFNWNENYIYFKPEWLLRMKKLKVLCLGRWQTVGSHHIEVDDDTFLSGLKNMMSLQFFSLQGIYGIRKLPNSISNLSNLKIMDLRACYNLEDIPEVIGALQSLTHLDISECYLLDHMPKGLASLKKLQVLKGFIVGYSERKNSCTLNDLAVLPSLTKLSVFTIEDSFPEEHHLKAFSQFQALRKLTIEWGEGSLQAKELRQQREKDRTTSTEPGRAPSNSKQGVTALCSPFKNKNNKQIRGPPESKPASEIRTIFNPKLEKLDLRCFPRNNTPSWLHPKELKGLKKLYIRGGKLFDLGDEKERAKWSVEVLRLKFLSKLEMDWRELQELFPDLVYLEKIKCPKLTFFPCDESGVWMKKTKLKRL